MRDLTELNKLEEYLKDHGIPYERIDNDKQNDHYDNTIVSERHQIIVPQDGPERKWDVICQWGSYGSEEGLLEIYGVIVRPCGDDVEGYLTANDVIKRIEEWWRLTMPRYIDADAYIKYCEEHRIPLNIDAVKAQPTVDVVMRKKGKWLNKFVDGLGYNGLEFECSECGKRSAGRSNYCAYCGAQMKSE